MPRCPAQHNSTTDDYCDVCGLPMGTPAPSRIGGDAGAFGTAGAGLGMEAAADPRSAAGPDGGWFTPAEPTVGDGSMTPTSAMEVCPRCQTPQAERFCEECGWDFEQGQPPRRPAEEAPLPRREPGSAAASGSAASRGSDGGGVSSWFSGGGSNRVAPVVWTAVVAPDRDYFEDTMARSGPEARSLSFPTDPRERRIRLLGTQIRIGRRSVTRGTVPEIDLSVAPEDPGVSHLHAVLQPSPDGGWLLIDKKSVNGTTVNEETGAVPAETPILLGDGDRIHVGAWTTITIRRS